MSREGWLLPPTETFSSPRAIPAISKSFAALALMDYMTLWSGMTGVERFCTVLECVLLAAVVVLTIFYARGPSDLDDSAT